jgi:hypothetical protein
MVRTSNEDSTYWSARSERITLKFSTLVKGSPFDFIEDTYNSYLISQHLNTLRDPILEVRNIQDSVRRCQNGILQVAGIGEEWKQFAGVAKAIEDVIRGLEEILCLAMSDAHELKMLHARSELFFQLA